MASVTRGVTTPASDITNDTSYGTLAWTAPENAGVDDTAYATRMFGTTTVADNVIRLVVDGTVVGDNKADTTTDWSYTEDVFPYGGDTILWGLTPSVAEINAVDFGVVLSVYQGTAITYYLKALNFGFSIPSGSTIDGIIVNFKRKKVAGARSAQLAYVNYISITVYYTEATSGTNLQVQVGDVFRPVSEIYVNVGDVWRSATAFVNVGDVWRS